MASLPYSKQISYFEHHPLLAVLAPAVVFGLRGRSREQLFPNHGGCTARRPQQQRGMARREVELKTRQVRYAISTEALPQRCIPPVLRFVIKLFAVSKEDALQVVLYHLQIGVRVPPSTLF